MSLPKYAEVLRAAALEYARHGWPVMPLNGKIPAIPRRHPRSIARQTSSCADGFVLVPNPLRDCRGGCGHHGHGLYDATTELATVTDWWSNRYGGCNIGGRVPESMIVIDVDPRNGGEQNLAELEKKHGPLPGTLTHYSGRGDGGRHLFFRRPPGDLSGRRLGSGIDLKTSSGYVVLPPSIHPESGLPYTAAEAAVAAPPRWLIGLLRAAACTSRGYTGSRRSEDLRGAPSSPAEAFCANTSWAEILEPHGWRCLDADPDEDQARWLHPAATSACSATIQYGCLFVWSTNTPFEVTEPGMPHGYTKFRANAVLNYQGDMREAAKAVARGQRR